MNCARSVWIGWVGVLACLIFSPLLPLAAADYSVRRWTAEQGLPQNRVTSIWQTGDGYMWFGSWFGLVRFDGVRPAIFDHDNTPELEIDTVSAMLEDPATGTLWIGTDGGLVQYKNHHFVHLGREANATVVGHAIWLTGDETVWYASHEPTRLIRVHRGEIASAECPDVGRWVTFVGDHGAGEAWVLSDAGLFRIDYARPDWKVTREDGPFPGGQVFSTIKDGKGRLWFGTEHGLFMTPSGIGEYRHGLEQVAIPGGGDAAVTVMAPGRDGSMWIFVKNRGLFQWIDGRMTAFTGDAALSNVQVYALMEDRDGTVWAGTRTGVVQLRPKHVNVITTADGLGDDEVWCVQEARDGTMWVGTVGGISTLRDGKAQRLDIGLPFDPPFATAEKRVQILWPQYPDRVWYGPDQLRVVVNGRSMPAPFVFPEEALHPQSIFEDRDHQMWFGGEGWVIKWDGTNQPVPIKIAEKGSKEFGVRVIHQDRRGAIWLGTYGDGIKRLTNNGLESYRTQLSKSINQLNNQMWSFHEDSDGIFWIGTENGLNRFVPPGVDPVLDAQPNPQRFYTFLRDSGLPDLVVNHVLEDDAGNLWLGALHGIYRVSRKELNDIAAHRSSAARFIRIAGEDGLLSVETNGERSPSACKSRDGRLWFPTDVGVAVIDPSAISTRTNVPAVLIESVVIDGDLVFGGGQDLAGETGAMPASRHSYSGEQPLRLEPGRARVVRFRYTAPTTIGADQMMFSIRLMGWETEPRNMRSERVFHYTNLKPGDYEFQVTAINGHGVAAAKPATFAFSLAPFFWQTWPFYIFCGCAVFAVAAAIQGYRLRIQRRISRLENAAALELERSRIAHDLHDELGSGLAQVALLAEMSDSESAVRKRPQDVAREMLKKLDGIVWALNPARANLDSVVDYLVGHAEDFVGSAGIRLRLHISDSLPEYSLDAARRHHLLLVFKEALRNVATHSQAKNTAVEIGIEAEGPAQCLRVAVRDDGNGFDPQKLSGKRNGLSNMRERAQQVGGSVEIRSSPGQGTEVIFILPLTEPAAKTAKGRRDS